MKTMLVGSKAIKYHVPTSKRTPHDTDYFTTDISKVTPIKGVDYFEIPNSVIDYSEVISLNDLYTLKISHTIRDLFYYKHLSDIRMLQNLGCKVNNNLLGRLTIFWDTMKGSRKTPNFEQENEEFFNDNVKREYNHDELHIFFMYNDRPMFEYIKENQNNASVSIEMFNKLNLTDKYKVVLEEAFVLAYERYVIGKRKVNTKRYAFNLAMQDLITRLLPQEIALFALSNYNQIDAYYKDFNKFIKESNL